MVAEYHLIDLACAVSHGGFRFLEAARQYALEECLIAWDIFHGNVRVEYHDPRADRLPEATGFHSFAPSPEYETVPLPFECLIWRLRLGRGPMLCAPILHPLGGDSFIRANMRLTAWPSSNCEQASFSAASRVG